ncbi:hypothetical protein KJ596_01735 [Patescibacteria group bacterium]|nr:hypothetical protein [Patescibacteria group bacterium]MBU1868377.1 hypothetical protein [Patescibacteria group bacterium]
MLYRSKIHNSRPSRQGFSGILLYIALLNLILLGIVGLLLYEINLRIRAFHTRLDAQESADPTLYPVFSQKDIRDQLVIVEVAKREIDEQMEYTEKLLGEKTGEYGQFTLSEHCRDQVEDNIREELHYERQLETYRFLIEANIAVLNGERIATVIKQWDDYCASRSTFILGISKKVDERYEAWKTSIKKLPKAKPKQKHLE